MNFAKITHEYYSQWLGATPEIMNGSGVIFLESLERDKQQIGYSNIFDIYIYMTDNLIIISYSKRLSDKIKKIKLEIYPGIKTQEMAHIIESIFNTKVKSSIKFCYDNLPDNIDFGDVVNLCDTDYPMYLEFFRTQYPNAKVEGWLEEYFNDMSKKGIVFGIFQNNKLVSATDAPDMPYMDDKVQEIGINTLPEYRCYGYAKLVTLACIKAIIEKEKCPQWSCATSNVASEKLAYGTGFKKLADVLTISI